MSRKPVDFTGSIRTNLAYDNTYGQHKNVHAPHWTGDEGDKAALMRSSFPNPATMAYFNGNTYNGQLRNYVTTALQGRGKSIYDLQKLKGENDFDTSGRDKIEYKTVSTSETSFTNKDLWIAAGIIIAAFVFITVTK